MKNNWAIPLTVLASIVAFVVLVAIVVLLVLATGSVTVGADVKPGLIVRTLAPWGRDRSVQRHAPKLKNPYAGEPNAIAEGMDHYREACLVCHGAPGVPMSEIAKGLEPPAPSLGKEEIDTPDGELFWVTKHGIRLTSMPAFGWTHSDEEIWKVVAFLRHMPELTAEEKEFLREAAADEHEHPCASVAPNRAGHNEGMREPQAEASHDTREQIANH
jgi:mono/diheme cytochrome c family protein